MTNSIFVAGGIALAQMLIGALLTQVGPWYRSLRKPWFNPPDWLFGPAWTLLLACTAASGVLAWDAAGEMERGRVILLFTVNGLLFMAWSPLFFTVKRPDWALIEVVPFWVSIVALIVGVAPISRTAALLLLPYLLWVSFAAVLNLAIVRLNRPFGLAPVHEKAH